MSLKPFLIYCYHLRSLGLLVVLLLLSIASRGQVGKPPIRDSEALSIPVQDSSSSDSTKTKDTASVADLEQRWGIKIAKDALPAAVTSTAKDSAVIDLTTNNFYLYGDAEVKYEEYNVKSGQIDFDQATGIVKATETKDTAGKVISEQQFSQGAEQFSFEKLEFNFRSKRALVSNAKSQYGEGFVTSAQVKRNADETIFGYRNLYTTCNLDTPHFGIRANKIKVVPGKIIASGPANLEIMGIPTPLYLPFGIFPIKQGQSSGFILPSYTLEENRGLGLQRGGYYFAINDYVGLTTQFDIFSKGSWAFSGTSQYVKRYQYAGNVQIGYNYTKEGDITQPNGSINKDFRIEWSHQQDGKARPGTNFNASVNIVTSGYNRLNGVDAQQLIQNDFSSSISYSKTWVGKPFNFSAAFRHNQNTQTGLVTLRLPDANFSVTQFSPFQRRNVVGIPRWYEKITTNYNVQLVNSLSFYDSNFKFSTLALSDFNNALVQTANISASYNVLKYFNLSFQIPYTEYWNTKQFIREYNTTTERIDTTINTGFFASRSFSSSANLSTRIYGIKLWKKGRVAGIRHVVNPSVGFTYQPGFAEAPFRYFYRAQLEAMGRLDYFSYYANNTLSPLGGPINALPNGSVTFAISNTVAMKLRNKDSTTKNVSILDGFNIGSSYNLFADSFRLANINMNARTNVLNVLNLSAGANFDPYVYEKGKRVDRLLISNGGLAQFRNAYGSVGFNYSSTSKAGQDAADTGKLPPNDQTAQMIKNGGYGDYYDFNIPFDFHTSYSMSAGRQYLDSGNRSIIRLNHSLTFGGSLTFTERWRLGYESGYNFTNREIGATSINISRDLHCWQMSLNLVPFGAYRQFNFSIQVKASVLQDLKITRRRSYLDNSL